MAQVCLCFHASNAVPLPAWVAEAGKANPDIYYTDRAGVRSADYVSLGADEVPVLAGRTALECYRDLMLSFRQELGSLMGGTIADVLIGLGPDGELKYPSHPRDKRWTFPGIGEFQCYDRYMLAGLRACSYQVSQPSWGLGGPHDAGSYCVWPHQTGFFHHYGNWSSAYGKFFLQWYSDMLLQHADAVLGTAREVLLQQGPGQGAAQGLGLLPGAAAFAGVGGTGTAPARSSSGGRGAGSVAGSGAAPSWQSWQGSGLVTATPATPPVRLHAKLPGLYWWYNTSSHAPELTAGYYNTSTRDGYLPVMKVLAKHGVGVRLRSAELRTSELSSQACCDPERQISQQRTVAAALQVPVGLENLSERFDDSALARLEAALFDTSVNQGIELPQVQSLVFNRMCDSMFEPGNWTRFKDFVRRVRNRADTLVVPPWRGEPQGLAGGAMEGPPPPAAAAKGEEARGGAAGIGSGQVQAA
ncbi:hypothetical protein GPECTOR_17g774 [Gonium pectorale]|uniref:Beta-amylase n=1 Tax=Gonium pectorale TaxID=33097 RepID=A0A150GJY3_GONPE|nr:hypothetical protein GPECTOR_17g774 [Gonium pectorale]|eukprot:KXZ50138.1 hypothetical protein GPECTOR_17g774 [Gonium pectorale]